MSDKTIRYFDEAHDDGFFPGVPKRDLTEAEYEAYPKWLQESIDASAMYRKTKPKQEKEDS